MIRAFKGGLSLDMMVVQAQRAVHCMAVRFAERLSSRSGVQVKWLLEEILLTSGWPMLNHAPLDIVLYSFDREEDSPFVLALIRACRKHNSFG